MLAVERAAWALHNQSEGTGILTAEKGGHGAKDFRPETDSHAEA
jgi:hypothetical protein